MKSLFAIEWEWIIALRKTKRYNNSFYNRR